MFNEELENALLDRFTKRFSQYNEKVLIELGNIIKEIGELIPKDTYRLSQQLKYNTTIDDLKKELANITGKSVKEIEIILEKIAKDNLEFASTYYKARNLDVPIYKEHEELQKLVKSIVKASQETFVNMAKSTGFKLLDSNKKPVFLNIEETYHKVVDEAIYAITTGKSTYTEQMRSITKQLSDSGVRILEYESGYTRRLDSAVRMNMIDTIKKVSNETNALFGKEFGSDGVEITVQRDPAPDHEDIQGHQFSNEEYEKFQKHQDCKDYKGNIIRHKNGKYERRQISEWNCRHRVFPVVLGISNPLRSDEELQKIIDDNNKGVEIDGVHYTRYEARQLQRQIETAIRQNKEKYITARSSDNEELMSKAREKVRLLGKKYKDICKQGNLKEDTDRLYIPNYTRK